MGLNIKNPEVEQLAAEIASMMRESKTRPFDALYWNAAAGFRLKTATVFWHKTQGIHGKNVWPLIPERQMGRRLSREEEDQILGYGPQGW